MSCACKIGGGPDGVCFECKSRRAFHARLKKLEDKAASDYARGVEVERARVVAWLESFGIGWFYAQRIERGEHEAIPKERHERKKLT